MERRIVEPQFTDPNSESGRRPLSTSASEREIRLTNWREIACLPLIVLLADLTVYRGHGYSGYALLYCALPVLFFVGTVRRERFAIQWLMGLLLA